MIPAKRHIIKPHRFARIVCWATAMLVWLELVLFGDTVRADRRRIRQRYRLASLDWAERLVRALAIVRAVEITRLRKIPRPPLRNAAAAGFRRRLNRAGVMRATVGSRFRKALKARDAHQRLKRLLAALSDIDGFTRRYLVPRALQRLTRLHAVTMVAPPAERLVSLAAPQPCTADSS